MTILSLDVGDIRVGLAAMDAALMIPMPIGAVLRAKGEAERSIIKLCQERNVSKIVIGLPLSEDGAENAQCEKVRNFARRLTQRIAAEICFVDEYFTSEEATQRLRDQGVNRAEEGRVDALAASIILERYLSGG